MSESGDVISRIYSSFRGVDFRGEEINLVRSPDSLNVWKDYKETESIRTRPTLIKCENYIGELEGHIHGIWFYKDGWIIHHGSTLTRYTNLDLNGVLLKILLENVSETCSNAFVCEDKFYFKDGVNYWVYDDDGMLIPNIKPVEGYIPTTTIGRKPLGGGEKKEDVNMLSDYRKNSFLADGVNFQFYLDVKNIDTDYVPVVEVDDKVVDKSKYTVDYAEGIIDFKEVPPDKPLTDGRDNVLVTFKKAVPKYKECIMKTTMLQAFDNRVFFSGNPDQPHVVWHSSLNDPSYISDLDYYKEGMDSAAVKGLVAGNNALWVFREPSDSDTTMFYHTPSLDEEYGKIYPSSHSSIATGCIGKAINFNDDIVFFSERGMEGISGDITTEQVVAHRSTLVDRKLTAEPNYKNMILEEWEGYLFVFIDNKVYLADSRAMFQNENHFEYEWFYWELDRKVTCTKVHDGVLYVGTENGIYKFANVGNVESYWVTPKDKFNNPHKLKTTNKRGCVVEAMGDVSVYVKTEKTDFELVGTHEDVQDYFTCRIKRKKWKDIQLKFHSTTRFSLETATLEAFVGGYIKR